MNDYSPALKQASAKSTLREMIRLVLAAGGNIARKPAELKDLLKAVGVPTSSLSNVGKTLANNSGDFVSVHGSWELRPQKHVEAKAALDEIVKQLGGQEAGNSKKSKTEKHDQPRVFVVHGHDHGFKNTVARFLEKLKLEAVILHEQPDGGRTVIEKFTQTDSIEFAIVLATPDDVGGKRKDKTSAPSDAPRARQNVIFELGYFVGKLGRARTTLVTDSSVELPSDLSGVIYVERRTWQKGLLAALTDAGFVFTQEQITAALAIHG